jgi:outer membrane protein assembly factor BamA
MNKNILWGSVIVVGVVLVVWLIVSKGNSPVQNVNTEDTTKSVVTEKPAVKSVASKPVSVAPTETFTNILPKLGNYQCDYEEVTQSTRSTNTVYLSDGRMRAEFRSRTADGTTKRAVCFHWIRAVASR